MPETKVDTVRIYQRVTGIIWQRLSPTFGIRTINAIAKNVVVRQSSAYPFVRHLRVNENGLDWSDVNANLAEVSEGELATTLEAMLDEFFEALSNLIGRLVVGKLFHEAEEMVKKGEPR